MYKEGNVMFCPQCGAPNEDDAVFCGNCGAVLDPDKLSAEPEDEAPEAASDEPIEEPFGETPEEVVEALLDEELAELVVASDELPPEPPLPPPPPPPPQPPRPPAAPTSGMAIAALIMGLAGWTVLPWVGSVLAIVFGYAARNEIRRRPGEMTGEGLATAGLVLGWLMVGVTVLTLCLGAIAFCVFAGLLGGGGY
jgi:hypothetical protein